MIDRSSQSRWRASIVALQNVRRLEIAAQAHLKICDNDWTDVRGARALGAWLFLLTGSRLRARCGAITLTQVNGCIRDQIGTEKEQGEERENAQKPGPMQRRHQPNG
jgi:hypothetical protein